MCQKALTSEKKTVITSLSLFMWTPDAKYLAFFFNRSFKNLDKRVTGRENFLVVLDIFIHPEKMYTLCF